MVELDHSVVFQLQLSEMFYNAFNDFYGSTLLITKDQP